MTDLDRGTFEPIDNFTSALQSVEVILSTRIGSRVMRREFGGGAAELLGRAITGPLFAAFQQLVATAIDLWEPRFQVRRVSVTGSTDEIRAGTAGFSLEVDYRPRGHLGDFRVERVVNFSIGFRAGGIQVAA